MSIPYKLVYLKTSSWAGISIGGEHTYAELTNGEYGKERKKVDLYLTLSTSDAIKLNKKYDTRGSYCRYRKGDQFHGFWTEADAVAQALRDWRKHFPDYDALVIDHGAAIRPSKILDGLDKLKIKANKLNDKYDAFGWIDENQAMRKISDQWYKLMETK